MLAQKISKQEYFQPTVQKDAHYLVRTCDTCQTYAHVQQQLAEPLQVMSSPWSSATWGIDMLDPFPISTTQKKFKVVVVDYFTKWIEAKALTTITKK